MISMQSAYYLSPIFSIMLKNLQGQQVGVYTLVVNSETKQIQGHFDVCIYLSSEKRGRSHNPCIKGLYSMGRKNGRYHFFDAQFASTVHFGNVAVNLLEESIEEDLFAHIGAIIRPGGQIYLSYINEEKFAFQMERAFEYRIPLITTVLGRLLFASGCRHVRSFYGAEGRFRIDGEKPVNEGVALKWAREIVDELNEYVARAEKHTPLDVECRQNARKLLVDLHKVLERGGTEPSTIHLL